MRIPDVSLTVPQTPQDFAMLLAKIEEHLRMLYQYSQTLPVVSSAPVATQLDESAMPNGDKISDVRILTDTTQTSRRIYFKDNGTLRYLESD